MAAPITASCPIVEPVSPFNAAGPIRITVPNNPIMTPVIFCFVIRSSTKTAPATNTVKNGVVALKMDANPELICVCPQTIRQNGSALFRRPITNSAFHCCRVDGKGSFKVSAIIHKAIAAKPTRNVTIVSGGRWATKTSTKKNDPPHKIDSVTNMRMSVRFIC